ncbi:MAG: PmoA family protein [Bacteroidota bacterium]|nr:PmoA family protein [Bacteroidota bacterium]
MKEKKKRNKFLRSSILTMVAFAFFSTAFAQRDEVVKVVKTTHQNKIDVFIGDKLFTSFLYPDTLEKPVLYPVHAANGTVVTRGFPMNPQPGDPTDHPHHLGIWFTYENVNGLDFWNNSYAIPQDKKHLYGWIRTDKVFNTSSGSKGIISYHANWTNQQKKVLLEENTRLEFSGTEHLRIIDRTTTLTADTLVNFTDAKDGLYGIRLAHALQIPSKKDEEFKDNKGNVTVVKGGTDAVANGNYLTSEGKTGDDAWSTRGKWCKVYGKMGKDSISIAIIDHPANPNYPTFWHARGYGLFAANPLGEKIFTNGKSSKNLQLKKGESVTFRYRIVIDANDKTLSAEELNKMADQFATSK